ncbi:MAG: hypothetical protein ACD_4C00200G0004 [uncultured bacterium (gcode 4)]|uniref:Uncharacterized protein n=1 Tax=uncultured bacterium (gcode 4) TaxID=1234023 RepID=K2F6H5_9BACT|nr:MAG: hypothetical protein ACD_4C00200G0004 [uncultured bacterium (gcode 4)]
MFSGKIYVYKNINGKKEEIIKEFDNEKDFDDFIEKNPSLKKIDFPVVRWPRSLFDIKWLIEEAEKNNNRLWINEIEEDLDRIFEKSRKLLRK